MRNNMKKENDFKGQAQNPFDEMKRNVQTETVSSFQ